MVDFNQSIIDIFQTQSNTSIEELFRLLGLSGDGSGISSTGFRDATFEGAAPDLGESLSGLFGGPTGLDTLQQSSIALGLLGPVGAVASFGLGQLARVEANKAFPKQNPIGFFEDILRPDIFFGTPLQIQQERAAAVTAQADRATRRGNVSTNPNHPGARAAFGPGGVGAGFGGFGGFGGRRGAVGPGPGGPGGVGGGGPGRGGGTGTGAAGR